MENKEKKIEEKIKDLENIINELESGNIDLEESISKYTEAMKLVKECDDKLKNIEKQVSTIVMENGEEQEFEIDE